MKHIEDRERKMIIFDFMLRQKTKHHFSIVAKCNRNQTECFESFIKKGLAFCRKKNIREEENVGKYVYGKEGATRRELCAAYHQPSTNGNSCYLINYWNGSEPLIHFTLALFMRNDDGSCANIQQRMFDHDHSRAAYMMEVFIHAYLYNCTVKWTLCGRLFFSWQHRTEIVGHIQFFIECAQSYFIEVLSS